MINVTPVEAERAVQDELQAVEERLHGGETFIWHEAWDDGRGAKSVTLTSEQAGDLPSHWMAL